MIFSNAGVFISYCSFQSCKLYSPISLKFESSTVFNLHIWLVEVKLLWKVCLNNWSNWNAKRPTAIIHIPLIVQRMIYNQMVALDFKAKWNENNI